MQGNPELPLVVTRDEAIGKDAVVTGSLNGDEGRVACRQHPKGERIAAVERLELTRLGVVQRCGSADAGDGRARAAKVCVPTVRSPRARSVLECEDDDAERGLRVLSVKVIDGGWIDAEDVVLNRLDLCEARESARRPALGGRSHAGGGERVVQEATCWTPGLDGARAGGCEVFEPRNAAVDRPQRLDEGGRQEPPVRMHKRKNLTVKLSYDEGRT